MKISSEIQSGLYKENQNTVKLMQTYFQSHPLAAPRRVQSGYRTILIIICKICDFLSLKNIWDHLKFF